MPTADDLRLALDDLTRIAAGDLRALWAEVADAIRAREVLAELLPLLVNTYGTAAATLAADWYDEARAEVGATQRFRAIPAAPTTETTDALARFAVGPLFAAEPDWRRARVLVEGGLQRRVANAARDTVTTSSVRDPAAKGWQRSASGGCAFCQMLAGRGAVYSQATVDFASHDDCRCVAVPAFEGQPVPVQAYTPSSRTVTDADRARVREYLATHQVG